MATVTVEFNDGRERLTLEHVDRAIDDFDAGRVAFEHRLGSVSYDSEDLSGWSVEVEDEDEHAAPSKS